MRPLNKIAIGCFIPIFVIFVLFIAFIIVGNKPCAFSEHFPEIQQDVTILKSWCSNKMGVDHTCIYIAKINDHKSLSSLFISNVFQRAHASDAHGLVAEYPNWWPPEEDPRITEIYLQRESDQKTGYPYLNRIVRYDPVNNVYYFQWYDL